MYHIIIEAALLVVFFCVGYSLGEESGKAKGLKQASQDYKKICETVHWSNGYLEGLSDGLVKRNRK